MRLLHVESLEIEEFTGASIPEYAILSHTWTTGEISFQDWATPSIRKEKKGYGKILSACRQARLDGLRYIWVDTNCIDKSSSAEMSEAINSMYDWYSKSVVCYGYLVDVPSATVEECQDQGSRFRKSRWFSRGWTLQELIAPERFVFYSATWTALGSKESLAQTISEVTGIDQTCLTSGFHRKRYSIARRMSWAANRSTTRPEDIAYCLLGLFDIHMPLLYGEGSRAFVRLQQEIMKISDDQSLLAWEAQPGTTGFLPIFATSPAQFCDPSEGKATPNWDERKLLIDITQPFSLNNVGLSIEVPRVVTLEPGLEFFILNHRELAEAGRPHIDVPFAYRTLIPVFKSPGGSRYFRVSFPNLTIPLPLEPPHSSFWPLSPSSVQLCPRFSTMLQQLGDDPISKGCNASISKAMLIDNQRAPDTEWAPVLEPEFKFAFIPIFPFGLGAWRLSEVYPPNSQRSGGILVPSPEDFVPAGAVILCFSKYSSFAQGKQNLGVFLAASVRSRPGLCCRILQIVKLERGIIRQHFARELEKYLKQRDMDAGNLEAPESVNNEPALRYGLNPVLHQFVAEDQWDRYSARVSLCLQNLKNSQLVAPVEIAFYDKDTEGYWKSMD